MNLLKSNIKLNIHHEKWRETYKEKEIKLSSIHKFIKQGQRIFIGTGCSEPQSLTAELVNHQSEIADCEIIHFLTIGKTQYFSKLEPSRFRHNALFIGKTMRNAVEDGSADYTPIKLYDIPRLFRSGRKHIDIALIQVSPPDESGTVSLGINVDINFTAVLSADFVIAQINPQMPRTTGDSIIDFSHIDKWVYIDEPLIEYQYQKHDDISPLIGKYISKLVENGSTLQMGIGLVPNSVIQYLKYKSNLSIFTEVFSDGIIDLVNSGAINKKDIQSGKSKIVTSFVMGTRRLYKWLDNNPLVTFRNTEFTNNPLNIAQNDKQVAINTALTVDLTGQVNSDSIGSKFYSGIGGQVDFELGASLSQGGKPIIALPSTTIDGIKSRIVSTLEEGAGVVINRGDVHYVVTEYGCVYLHGKTIRERALLLIGISHPKFRTELLEEAKRLNYIYRDQQLPMTKDGVVIVYPELFESEYFSRSGLKVKVRPIKFTDERLLQELYYSLSESDRRLRFFAPLKTFSHKLVQSRVIVDYESHMAIVGLVGKEPDEKIIATAEYVLDRDTNLGEIAMTVHEDYRKQGVGRYILERLLKIAQNKGLNGITGDVLFGNSPMMHILKNLDYEVQFRGTYGGETSFNMLFKDNKKIMRSKKE